MLVTVTNLTTRKINSPDSESNVIDSVASLVATGGSRTDPLPYPFDLVGELDESGGTTPAAIKAMHPADFHRQHNMWQPLEPAAQWNQLIQAGTVSFGIGAEASKTDTEELYHAAL